MAETARELISRQRFRCLYEWARLESNAAELARRVERVLALHKPLDREYAHGNVEMCEACNHRWPCPTVHALDGLE